MSASLASAAVASAEVRAATPSFPGIVRGELFKVSRQRSTWIMAALLVGLICLPFVVNLTSSVQKDRLAAAPLQTMYLMMASNLMLLRVFSGTFLIILTARLIGVEYSGGTIRVLLARGVGRLQLLGAKLLAVALVALAILLGGILLDSALTYVFVKTAGNLDALNSLNATFWADARMYALTVALSMGVTILMAAAVTVVGRSLAIGLSVGLSWFPADNIGVVFFRLASRLTHSNFWTLITGDFLGPNLNEMPNVVLSSQGQAMSIGSLASPLVPVTGGHTLLITLLYAAAFAVVAVVLTWRRDVTE